MSNLAFWMRFNNDRSFTCSECWYSTKTATEECPDCKRTMINIKNIREDKKK